MYGRGESAGGGREGETGHVKVTGDKRMGNRRSERSGSSTCLRSLRTSWSRPVGRRRTVSAVRSCDRHTFDTFYCRTRRKKFRIFPSEGCAIDLQKERWDFKRKKETECGHLRVEEAEDLEIFENPSLNLVTFNLCKQH